MQPLMSELSAQIQSHHMPSHASSPGFMKPCVLEHLDVSHEAVAGRVGINWIRFDDGRAALLGVLHRCFNNLTSQSLTAQLSPDEKADQRPDMLGTVANVAQAAELTVRRPRCDRAPRNGLALGIAEQPDRNVTADQLPHRSFAICPFCGFGASSPYHAPARLWSTSALEQALEVSPPCIVHFVKLEVGHVQPYIASADAFNDRSGPPTSARTSNPARTGPPEAVASGSIPMA